jgi:hypothetical protein
MVDRISGQIDNRPEAGLLGINTQQGVEKTGAADRSSGQAAGVNLVDEAAISDEARETYAAEKETIRFSRMVQRGKESVDLDKVARFKELLDNGRINEYLRSLNTDALAESLLSSSSGAFLKQA